MGHHLSKSDQEAARSIGKGHCFTAHYPRSHDDVLSRATEITDESSTPPPSPSTMKNTPRGGLRRGQALWRGLDNADYVTISGSRAGPRQQQHQRLQPLLEPSTSTRVTSYSTSPSLLQRRDSDPGAKEPRRAVPVKCPPRQTQSVAGVPGNPASPGHDEAYLERMYDSRTWEMYRRITEARQRANRKHQQTTSSNGSGPVDHSAGDTQRQRHCPHPTNASLPGSEDTSEWENLRHDCGDSFLDDSGGQHEMIFLFDF